MTVKTFVDSNILIYAHDSDAGPKQQRAAERLTELWDAHTGRLSTQELQEFYVNVTQKIKEPLSRTAAREVIPNYTPWVESWTPATVLRASEIGEIWQISFRDGMPFVTA